ncbi:MAG: OmpH family outer membrane protein [Chitinophagaceae bacterium]|jgi:outer membrane protein|nr:MAG: OmpH family outer membrane protein [Chitinophagaceae bacterium]
MKKLTLIAVLFLFGVTSIMAQRFAYVDTEYILKNIPEYNDAQKKLDDAAEQWQQEIRAKYENIERLYRSFQSEQVLLTDDMKRQREEEIMKKEREVKEFQRSKFGPEGELFQKRQSLVKPIQDKVYDEIQKLAAARNYDFIFDKSGGVTMLHANTRYDQSDVIIRALGYTPSN